MSENEKLAQLVKWPTTTAEVTVDLMLRIVGADTQRTFLRKMRLCSGDPEFMKSPLYHAMTQDLITGVGFMACLRALRKVSEAEAQKFAVDYWLMCDAGDSFGELLWDFTWDAGLDPRLIEIKSDDRAAQ